MNQEMCHFSSLISLNGVPLHVSADITSHIHLQLTSSINTNHLHDLFQYIQKSSPSPSHTASVQTVYCRFIFQKYHDDSLNPVVIHCTWLRS